MYWTIKIQGAEVGIFSTYAAAVWHWAVVMQRRGKVVAR